MTGDFDAAFAEVVGLEGGLSVDPADPGNYVSGIAGEGELRGTKFGISAASFPTIDIPSLTLDQAKALYHAHYWSQIAGDSLPSGVALAAFDSAVNQGVGTAARLLQAAAGVSQDGSIGPLTLAAVTKAGPALLAEFCARRAVHYAQGNMATYGLGWMRRLFTVAVKADAMAVPSAVPAAPVAAVMPVALPVSLPTAPVAAVIAVSADVSLIASGLATARGLIQAAEALIASSSDGMTPAQARALLQLATGTSA